MQEKILVVEDDIYINDMIKEILCNAGYVVVQAYSGTEGVLCVKQDKFHMVLLDLMLPGMDGEEVLENILLVQKIPIIVVSAKDDKDTRLNVMLKGADDYLVKPFDKDELLVRIKVVMRRYVENDKLESDKEVINYKNIKIYPSNYQVTVDEREISLTKREYLILELLMSNPNKVFTKNNIFESVWKEEFVGEDNAVNVHISNIRNKLAKVSPNESYIKTVWGLGFKME